MNHQPCTTRGGHNIAENVQSTFKWGLVFLLADIVNTHVISFCIHFFCPSERLYMQSAVVEATFASLTVFVSLFQILMLISGQGRYCMKTVLVTERNWLIGLILLQLMKVIAFAVLWPNSHDRDFFSLLLNKGKGWPDEKDKQLRYKNYTKFKHDDEEKQEKKSRIPLTPHQSPRNAFGQ